MLTRATFANYKALRSVDVDLTPFTVLVGKNGSGKTSVLQGIQDLLHATHGPWFVPAWPRGPQPLVTRPSTGPLQLSLTDASGRSFSLQAKLALDDDGSEHSELTYNLLGDRAQRLDLTLRFERREDAVGVLPGGAEAPRRSGFMRAVRSFFGAGVLLRPDARVMAHESATLASEPTVEDDGDGLASVLNYLAGAAPEVLEEIRRDLTAVVPQVRGIRTFPARVRQKRQERIVIGDQAVHRVFEEEVAGHRFAIDMGPGRLIEADLVSEGTVLALGLLTALRHPRCPKLVLLDDIDGGLHSTAQAELVRAIRAILAARPDVQVICSSHSPDLLDNVSLEEIRVMALDRDGYARCARLADHPESARWRGMLRTGEFWSSVGEDWLLEVPPTISATARSTTSSSSSAAAATAGSPHTSTTSAPPSSR